MTGSGVEGASEPAADVLVVRPRRLRFVAISFAVGLVVLAGVFWVALPGEIRVLFTISQLLTLLGFLGVLILIIAALAASSVRADGEGLRIRNGLRVYEVPWRRVHKIILRNGDPWALVLLRPADGQPFSADLDAEKRQLMGVQAGDGAFARESVDLLRSRLERARRAP